MCATEIIWKPWSPTSNSKKIFEQVLKSDFFKADELPPVPEELKRGQEVPRSMVKQKEIGEEE